MVEFLFIKADEVVKMLEVSQSKAYRIIKKLNEEMDSKGYIQAVPGRIKYDSNQQYRNQYIHGVLDRRAALELLDWGETGARAPAIPNWKQRYLLQSLEQILHISGIQMDIVHDPIWLVGHNSKKEVVAYPAMWKKPVAENTVFVSDAHLKYAKPYALKALIDSL